MAVDTHTCFWRTLCQNLDALRQDSHLCDLKIISGDNGSFMTHSTLLSASCNYFINEAMDSQDRNKKWKQQTIKLDMFSSQMLKLILDFIYGTTPTSIEDLKRLKCSAQLIGFTEGEKYAQNLLQTKQHNNQENNHVDMLSKVVALTDPHDREDPITYIKTENLSDNESVHSISHNYSSDTEDLEIDIDNKSAKKKRKMLSVNKRSAKVKPPQQKTKSNWKKGRKDTVNVEKKRRPSKRALKSLTDDELGVVEDEMSADKSVGLPGEIEFRKVITSANDDILVQLHDRLKQQPPGPTCLSEGCLYDLREISAIQQHMYKKHQIGVPHIGCMQCDSAYFTTKSLRAHIRRAHSTEPVPPSFQCDQCAALFNTKWMLKIHQVKEHKCGQLFSCTECEHKSPRKRDIQSHLLVIHNITALGITAYRCSECDFKTLSHVRYKEHMNRHSGIRDLQCYLCGKTYSSRRSLTLHMAFHNPERPFKCTQCPSTYKLKGKLSDHVRKAHMGKERIKRYKCSYCSHICSCSGNCRKHMKNSHPDKPIIVIDTMLGIYKKPQISEYNDSNHYSNVTDVSADWYMRSRRPPERSKARTKKRGRPEIPLPKIPPIPPLTTHTGQHNKDMENESEAPTGSSMHSDEPVSRFIEGLLSDDGPDCENHTAATAAAAADDDSDGPGARADAGTDAGTDAGSEQSNQEASSIGDKSTDTTVGSSDGVIRTVPPAACTLMKNTSDEWLLSDINDVHDKEQDMSSTGHYACESRASPVKHQNTEKTMVNVHNSDMLPTKTEHFVSDEVKTFPDADNFQRQRQIEDLHGESMLQIGQHFGRSSADCSSRSASSLSCDTLLYMGQDNTCYSTPQHYHTGTNQIIHGSVKNIEHHDRSLCNPLSSGVQDLSYNSAIHKSSNQTPYMDPNSSTIHRYNNHYTQ